MSEAASRATVTLRGVNEYVYCPRLFWLEWVAGEFEHNEHTVHGSHVHRAVDKPGGVMDAPDGDEPWQTKSLWLGDDDLGLSGKVDLVEEVEHGVMPVDTKKGKPPRGGGLWPSDRVQLVLQAVLLRAHGYTVDSVAVYYATPRRRVVEPLTIEMIDDALASAEEARRALNQPDCPPPLVDSPKCKGCSLNAICMPDEMNALGGLSDEPRQVLVPRNDAWPVYIVTPGSRVTLSKRQLIVRQPEHSDEPDRKIPMEKASELNLMGGIQITTQALQACMEREIPVRFFSYGGWYYGRATGFSSKNVAVRIAQFRAYETALAVSVARVLIADKIHNSRVLLLRNSTDDIDASLRALKRNRNSAARAVEAASLLGFEGEAARNYWEQFSAMCAQHNEGFAMDGRNRRPPRDATNSMLGFAYALLTKDCVRAIEAAGLDPFLGLYHTPHHGRPALALDLMEPFRPLIADSVVLQLIRRDEVKPNDFVRSGPSVSLSTKARKALIAAYERRMSEEILHPVFGYRASYRRTLAIQARLLARTLTGELDDFPSFRTR